MPKELRMSVLIASSNEKFDQVLLSLLPTNEFGPVDVVNSAGAARRRLDNISYDLLIVNAPLKDERGANLAVDIASETGIGVLLFLDAAIYDEISAKAEEYGVLTLSKPTSKAIVSQSLKLICATRQRLKKMEVKAQSFEEKIEEIKLVNRAKLLLREKEDMDENSAHRFLEKLAIKSDFVNKVFSKELIEAYCG